MRRSPSLVPHEKRCPSPRGQHVSLLQSEDGNVFDIAAPKGSNRRHAFFMQVLLHCRASPLDVARVRKEKIDFTRTLGLLSPRFDFLLASTLASRAPRRTH